MLCGIRKRKSSKCIQFCGVSDRLAVAPTANSIPVVLFQVNMSQIICKCALCTILTFLFRLLKKFVILFRLFKKNIFSAPPNHRPKKRFKSDADRTHLHCSSSLQLLLYLQDKLMEPFLMRNISRESRHFPSVPRAKRPYNYWFFTFVV